jgi:hypothetical protein
LLAAQPNSPQLHSDAPSRISFSIHLFKLAKINSEIKYVANSIVRDTPVTPGYAYPIISNIHEWQDGVLQQLDQWAKEIPQGGSNDHYIHVECQIRYHSLRMLLLRPSPAIPKPSVESLKMCYRSASRSIIHYDELYRKDLLVHSWITFHGLILSTITKIYCIRTVPDIARIIELDELMGDFGASLSILSAIGEHWSGAKRNRDVLHELSHATIRWLKDSRSASDTVRSGQAAVGVQSSTNIPNHETVATATIEGGYAANIIPFTSWDSTFPGSVEVPLIGDMWPFPIADPFGTMDFLNGDIAIRSLFEDLISQPI